MHFLLKLSFVLLAGMALAAAGSEVKTELEQPLVDITPRARVRSAQAETGPRANIRVDTTLVSIPMAVTDPLSRSVTGLDKENFRLYEDKVEQKITHVSSEDVPISIGIVFDTSGSMGAKLARSREAVAQFLRTANPEDECFLIEINDRPELSVGFTPSLGEIQSRLTFAQAKGRTALLDGVYMAMTLMKKARNPRKAILIISDGGDNSSPLHRTGGEERRA